MSAEYKSAIAKLYKELEGLSAKAKEIKKTINMLSHLSGENEPFSDVESIVTSGKLNLRNDQFFGKSFASAVKEFLRLKGQAATAEDIMKGLEEGGFEFPWKPNLRFKNTAISLGKNSNDFVYIKSSNAYGLWEFYPEKKKEKNKKSTGNSASDKDTETLENQEQETDNVQSDFIKGLLN